MQGELKIAHRVDPNTNRVWWLVFRELPAHPKQERPRAIVVERLWEGQELDRYTHLRYAKFELHTTPSGALLRVTLDSHFGMGVCNPRVLENYDVCDDSMSSALSDQVSTPSSSG